MKIIEQSHEILYFSENLLKDIELAARTCYKSEDKITKGSAEKLIKNLIKNKHNAMIEFSDIVVKLITNRGVTHELVRHRLCSFAQESTRYVKYGGDMEFIRPVWCSPKIIGDWEEGPLPELDINSNDSDFMHCCLGTQFDYQTLLDNGWQPQQAREVLPNSLKTEIVVKANIREWRHIFNLRCSKKAHPQIRSLMLSILNHFYNKIPILVNDLYLKYYY